MTKGIDQLISMAPAVKTPVKLVFEGMPKDLDIYATGVTLADDDEISFKAQIIDEQGKRTDGSYQRIVAATVIQKACDESGTPLFNKTEMTRMMTDVDSTFLQNLYVAIRKVGKKDHKTTEKNLKTEDTETAT